MTTEVMLYRQTNPDGTAKDWAVPTLTEGSVKVYFGRTGSTLRLAETPKDHCRNGSLKQEIEARMQEKRAKGYQALGVFALADNRRDLTPLTDTAAASVATTSTADADPAKGDPSVSAPSLYWYWPERAKKVELPTRNAACKEILMRFAAMGWTLADCPSNTEEAAIWSVVTKDATRGIVPLVEDHKPLVAFFIYLTQRCHLSVANEQGQIITTWPSELPIEAAILETLGLRPKDPNRLLTALPGGEWFY